MNCTQIEIEEECEDIPDIVVVEKEENDEEEEEEDMEESFQKLGTQVQTKYLESFHPLSKSHNNDEMRMLCKVTRDVNGIIIDGLHRTIPFLTKYERTRILGQRAKQLDHGHTPFIKVSENIIDSYLIAVQELEQKKIPFVIRRPMPCGASEYWDLRDLEIIC